MVCVYSNLKLGKLSRALGVVTPSPACLRALKSVTEVLQKNGHEIVTL